MQSKLMFLVKLKFVSYFNDINSLELFLDITKQYIDC